MTIETSVLDLEGALGIRAAGSSWPGDYGAAGGLKIGVRIAHQFGVYALTRLGVHTVDERLVTFLSIGVQYWPFPKGSWRPYVRLAGVHQHEESFAAVDQNPGGAVFGVGLGIRHRYGTEFALGVDHPLKTWEDAEIYVGTELTGGIMGYSSGPTYYGGAGLSLGVNLGLL